VRSGVVIASQSGHRLPALTPEQDKALATTPAKELLAGWDLRNWRAMRLGASLVKIGKAVLHPLDELDA
jgi:hypothetical protein